VLDNAQRFSPENKPVRVLVRDADAGALTIRVEDDGPGILPEHRGRIFERFFTTDTERDGTGLGLAIVKSVMLAHGGSVAVESAMGVGTAIELRLPAPASGKAPKLAPIRP
jgi:signal transduction histidine kinase